MGWRYQIPALVDMGFRVVAPDMMGYGSTVSSEGTSNVIEQLSESYHRMLLKSRPTPSVCMA
jgi:hypothetical protein